MKLKNEPKYNVIKTTAATSNCYKLNYGSLEVGDVISDVTHR